MSGIVAIANEWQQWRERGNDSHSSDVIIKHFHYFSFLLPFIYQTRILVLMVFCCCRIQIETVERCTAMRRGRNQHHPWNMMVSTNEQNVEEAFLLPHIVFIGRVDLEGKRKRKLRFHKNIFRLASASCSSNSLVATPPRMTAFSYSREILIPAV